MAEATTRSRSESPAQEGAYESDLASNPSRPMVGEDDIYAPLPTAPGVQPCIQSAATSSELLAPASDRWPLNSFYKTKEYWHQDYLHDASTDMFLARKPDQTTMWDDPEDNWIDRGELPARQLIDVLGCDPPPPGWFGPRAYMIFAKEETREGLRQVKELLLESKVDRQNIFVNKFGWVMAMLSEEQKDLIRLNPIVAGIQGHVDIEQDWL